MNRIFLSLSTAYLRTFIPKGGRLEKTEYPLTSWDAGVESISLDEAHIAFRLHYPVRRPPLRHASSTVEIISHRGKLYWPYGEDIYRTALDVQFGQRVDFQSTVAEWESKLVRNRDLLKIVPSKDAIVERETFSRVKFPSVAHEVQRRVQQSLAENYLVCDGRVYVRGGPPVYVQWRLPHNSRRLVIVSAHPDDVMKKHDMYSPPAYHDLELTQRAFRERLFWLPGEETTMKNAMSQSGPRIESLLAPCESEDIAFDIQVGALFRETGRLLTRIIRHAVEVQRARMPAWAHFSDGARLKLVSDISFPYKQAALNDATSETRRAALRSILLRELRHPLSRGPSDIRSLVHALEDLEQRRPAGELNQKDLAALEQYGFF